MSPRSNHLVCLFLVTAGQNDENIAVDEEQIIELVYLLYDVTNNKVLSLQQHYVRPAADDIGEARLTEECKSQTGLSEDRIRNAQSLEYVLDELDRFLRSKEIHPNHGGRPFCFCTVGPLHLRQCLHPEAFRKKITLPSHFYKYFDLRKCVQQQYHEEDTKFTTLKDITSYLGLEPDQSIEYGARHCQDMSQVIHRLITDGHQFIQPEIIMEKLEGGVCFNGDNIDDETVVKARGLPWQSSDQDIANFFRGLNIARGGVALCLSQQGRRNGEALVRFEDREQRILALRRHKHHLGQRYIEVYRATAKDFLNIAGGSSRETQLFLSRHSADGAQVIVRMRGLPYTCTADQVIKFFEEGSTSVSVLNGEDGILFVHQSDGKATGDAFVLFTSDEVATRALTKHRQCIGPRYIELFKSTTAEVLQVLNRSLDPRTPSSDGRNVTELTLLAVPALSALHGMVPPAPQQLITSGNHRDCIRLRGLPLEASVTDIVTFLAEHAQDIVSHGVHLIYNSEGAPSGEAFIQMNSEMSAELATLAKNKKLMFVANKHRYIDVFQCSGDEMSILLQHGLPAPICLPQQPSLQTVLGIPPPSACPTDMRPVLQQRPSLTAMIPQFIAGPGCIPQASFFAVSPSTTHLGHNVMSAPPCHLSPAIGTIPSHPSPAVGTITPQLFALPGQATVHRAQPGTTTGHGLNMSMAPGYTVGMAATANGYQPVIYWYPSPPVSPQNTFIMPACPATVLLKGLPYTSKITDVLSFFDGIYEIQPDIQFQRGSDGKPNGEAYITFGSRLEAERAINERHRKLFGNRLVELQLVI